LPRKPRLAVVRIGEVVIEVYDEKLFWEIFRVIAQKQGNESAISAISRISAISAIKSHKSHKVDKCNKCDKVDKVDSENEAQTQLPSFIEGNPWLDILSKREKKP